MPLTDDQCNEFRRLPVSFNDMVRAIHTAGIEEGANRIAELEAEVDLIQEQWINQRVRTAGFVRAKVSTQKTEIKQLKEDLHFAYTRAKVLADICKIPVHESPEVTGTILGLVRGHVERLEIDCKAMATVVTRYHVEECHDCPDRHNQVYERCQEPPKSCCTCPACLIAAKYREETKWKVTADHPVLARPDKYGMAENNARAYADSLRALGYENVNVTIEK